MDLIELGARVKTTRKAKGWSQAQLAQAAGVSRARLDAIAMTDERLVAVLHTEGAQIYECKPDAGGKNTWQFREPIATLLMDGKTVGRHYAGPSWELADGSAVTAKVVGRTPGATFTDIPLLMLEVTWRRSVGQLLSVKKIQRLNTKGGALDGSCPSPGAMASVPYAADYAFWQDPR